MTKVALLMMFPTSEPLLLPLPICRVPPVIVVGPAYVLAAVSTKVPAPIFSIGRGPLSSEITPACIALPVVTWICVALLLTTMELAMAMPLA